MGVALAALFTPPAAASTPIQQLVGQLASEDYAERFDAALQLVESEEPGLDSLLSDAIEQGRFRTSLEATAAAEFVIRKRSGGRVVGPPLSPEGVNILLISIDTLRSDHLGCYGYDRNTSPTIDRLAERGALFLNAFSPASWTLPTHMSILTSLYPSFHKLDRSGPVGDSRLDESEPTLPEVLKEHGYTSVGFVTHLYLSPKRGYNRGFDLYRVGVGRADGRVSRARFWMDWHEDRVRRGLETGPFFMFLHLIDPHEPYDAPAPYGTRYFPNYHGRLTPERHLVTLYESEDFETADDYRYAVALYDGEISFSDASLRPLFEKIREAGWDDSTIVVLTSDHGEEFKDHGSMGHKNTLYDEQLRVPLVVTYPPEIEAGTQVEAPVSLLDVLPTILELVGAEPPERIQGRSLTPYLKTMGPRRPRPIFAELGPLAFPWEYKFHRRAVRFGPYKLIYNYLPGGSLTKELYELPTDPGELFSVYESRSQRPEVRELEARLQAFIRDGLEYNPEFRSKNSFRIDPETHERLQELGYLR